MKLYHLQRTPNQATNHMLIRLPVQAFCKDRDDENVDDKGADKCECRFYEKVEICLAYRCFSFSVYITTL